MTRSALSTWVICQPETPTYDFFTLVVGPGTASFGVETSLIGANAAEDLLVAP